LIFFGATGVDVVIGCVFVGCAGEIVFLSLIVGFCFCPATPITFLAFDIASLACFVFGELYLTPLPFFDFFDDVFFEVVVFTTILVAFFQYLFAIFFPK